VRFFVGRWELGVWGGGFFRKKFVSQAEQQIVCESPRWNVMDDVRQEGTNRGQKTPYNARCMADQPREA